MNADRMPSGRAGVFDGLRAGFRKAATWSDEPDPAGCYYRSRHCHGRQVTIRYMADRPNGGYHEYQQLPACEGHAGSEHRLHPDGEPTDAYQRWQQTRSAGAQQQ